MWQGQICGEKKSQSSFRSQERKKYWDFKNSNKSEQKTVGNCIPDNQMSLFFTILACGTCFTTGLLQSHTSLLDAVILFFLFRYAFFVSHLRGFMPDVWLSWILFSAFQNSIDYFFFFLFLLPTYPRSAQPFITYAYFIAFGSSRLPKAECLVVRLIIPSLIKY